MITGAALGLPGYEQMFDDANIARILRRRAVHRRDPPALRREMLDKHITRLVKGEDGGASLRDDRPRGATSSSWPPAAARSTWKASSASPPTASPRSDRATQLAIAAGIDALRDAGIPLVMRYKTTSTGTQLPDRWGLPDAMRDDTGVIFASAFPGYDSFADELARYYDRPRPPRATGRARGTARARIDARRERPGRLARSIAASHELQPVLETEPYMFDRRFLFRVLSMGHSQFAEFIGARGPNTQINSACASTTQAIALARGLDSRRPLPPRDRGIRRRRHLRQLLPWIGAGFLATGAAATDDVVEDAAASVRPAPARHDHRHGRGRRS